MDIKLVKNFEEGNYIPVNDQLLLQVLFAGRIFLRMQASDKEYAVISSSE